MEIIIIQLIILNRVNAAATGDAALREALARTFSSGTRFACVLRGAGSPTKRGRTGAVKHSGLVDKFALAAVVGRARVRPRI